VVTEILNEIGKDILASPLRMVAELVQFALLVGIAWVVAIGFGKRRGFVKNMVSERRQKIAEHLEDASHARDSLTEAQRAAEELLASATTEAAGVLDDAKRESAQAEEAERRSSEAEAARIVERAKTALANEQAQMQADLRDELVDLVSEATRSIMNEALTVAEQRERIEEAIVSGVSTDKTRRRPHAANAPNVAQAAGKVG